MDVVLWLDKELLKEKLNMPEGMEIPDLMCSSGSFPLKVSIDIDKIKLSMEHKEYGIPLKELHIYNTDQTVKPATNNELDILDYINNRIETLISKKEDIGEIMKKERYGGANQIFYDMMAGGIAELKTVKSLLKESHKEGDCK